MIRAYCLLPLNIAPPLAAVKPGDRGAAADHGGCVPPLAPRPRADRPNIAPTADRCQAGGGSKGSSYVRCKGSAGGDGDSSSATGRTTSEWPRTCTTRTVCPTSTGMLSLTASSVRPSMRNHSAQQQFALRLARAADECLKKLLVGIVGQNVFALRGDQQHASPHRGFRPVLKGQHDDRRQPEGDAGKDERPDQRDSGRNPSRWPQSEPRPRGMPARRPRGRRPRAAPGRFRAPRARWPKSRVP